MAVHTGSVIPAQAKLPGYAPGGSSLINGAGVYFDLDGDWVILNGSVNGGVQLGLPSAVAGTGLRIGASRIIFANKPTAPVDIAGGVTATVTQILEAGIFLCSASASLTLPTMQGASGLVQALPGAQVGDLISFIQVVAAGQTATLVAGTGSTLGGIATTAAATTGRQWIGRVTAVTANAETVTWY